jgi:hypothetical protein
MLRVCCERVAKILRMWLLARSNISSLSSLIPHVATMWRLYCGYVATCVACNGPHQEPPLLNTTPNTTCLQHQNATSATLKFNVCNTQQHVSATSRLDIRNIENRCLQHQKYLDLILKHSHGTLATYQGCGCNMFTTIAT